MNQHTPQRIIELWPALPEEAREAITDLAESSAVAGRALELTPHEQAQLQASFADFKEGRVIDEAEFRRSMAAFLAGLHRAT
jgi:hypothetical protein